MIHKTFRVNIKNFTIDSAKKRTSKWSNEISIMVIRDSKISNLIKKSINFLK
jgi:hypothetical protein